MADCQVKKRNPLLVKAILSIAKISTNALVRTKYVMDKMIVAITATK